MIFALITGAYLYVSLYFSFRRNLFSGAVAILIGRITEVLFSKAGRIMVFIKSKDNSN